MNYDSDVIAEGVLVTSEASLYSPTTAIVNATLVVTNTSSVNTRQLILLIKKNGGTAREIDNIALIPGPGSERWVEGICLGDGDDLRGYVDGGTDTTWVLSGGLGA